MNDDSQRQWLRAHQLAELERWPEAFRSCRAAIAADLEADEPHGLMAVILLESGYPDKAAVEAREACRLKPENPEHHRALALSYAHLARFKEAEEEAEESLRLDPEESLSHAVLARIHGINERWPECEAACRRGLDLDPDHDGLLILLAHALEQQRRGDEAKLAIEAALRLDPESPAAQRLMGQRLMQQGLMREAHGALQESMRQDPGQDPWWYEQAIKGRSFWYRPFLRLTLFMARLPRSWALALVVGLWAGHLWIARITEEHPGFRPYGYAISAVYVLFVIYTWVADPIAQALLRRRGGRHDR